MVKYCPENYITIRQQRKSLALIDSDYQSFQSLSDELEGIDVGVEAQKKLSEIELHLAQAHDFYFKSQFSLAIGEYVIAEILIYQLLYPEVSEDSATEKGARLSKDVKMFSPMMKAALGLVEVIPPKTVEPSFGPAFPDPRPPVDIAFSVDQGIDYADPYIRKARVSSQLAEAYYNRSQWSQSEFFLRQSLSILSGSSSLEAKSAKAAVDLSLGAVLLQTGRTEEALGYLNTALNEYQSRKDLVGQAQVSINMAAAFKKIGQHDKFTAQLNMADKLLKQASGGASMETIRTPGAIDFAANSFESIDLTPSTTRLISSSSYSTSNRTKLIRRGSIQPETLSDLPKMSGMAVTYRQLGQGAGWSKQKLETKAESIEKSYNKELNARIGNQALKFQWESKGCISSDQVIKELYDRRIYSNGLADVNMEYHNLAEFGLVLCHQFFFVIPVALGDCFRALGAFAVAMLYYLSATEYPFINLPLEAPNLWLRIAETILQWGDSLCREEPSRGDEALREAIGVYRFVMEPPGSSEVVWSDSPLYKHPHLKPVGDKVKVMLANLSDPNMRYNNSALVAVVLTIRARLLGMNASNLPIWSFDYLQSVATHFAQRAIQAERDFINFMDRADQEGFTQKEIEQSVALTAEEEELAKRQAEAAEAERSIYEGTPLGSGYDGRVKEGGIFQSDSANFVSWINPARFSTYGAPIPDTVRIKSPSDGMDQIYGIQSVDSATQLTLKTQPPVGSNLQWSLNRKSTTARWLNATKNREDYKAMSDDRTALNKDNAWYSSQNPWELNNPVPGTGQIVQVPVIGDITLPVEVGQKHIHEIIAENTQRSQTITSEYELSSMDRQINDLYNAEGDSQAQLNAVTAKVEAARQMVEVAALRKRFAQENLEALKNQVFTADVWSSLGNFMYTISKSYLSMAIEVALMMQRAYNFENDTTLKIIRKDYSNVGIKRSTNQQEFSMLASDALLLDIESFTYDMVTTIRRKELPIKQTISLSERYPFLFETAFRQTGRIDFDTRMEDFDMAYPGTYGGRIESIEVEIDGVLPRSGVRGTLTNSGISRYRTSDINNIKFRLQPRETLILSEYRLKGDSMIYPSDPRKLKVFEGAGVAGSWTLEIPRSTNDLDFNSIIDARLVFYYRARYDENLASSVKSWISTLSGKDERSRILPLRWIFPDAFFHFQDTGSLEFSLNELYFPFNELSPAIRRLGLVMMVEPGIDPSAWKIRLGTPEHAETIAASPNSKGEIVLPKGDPSNINHPWKPLIGGKATGDYKVEIIATENPSLAENGVLKLEKIRNIVVIMDYTFTPRI